VSGYFIGHGAFPGFQPFQKIKLFIWGENDSAKLSSVIKDVFASLSFSFGTIRILVASNKVFLTH
jgi:hypothetical protein